MEVSDRMSFCRLSWHSLCPYMSMADKNMDSIWLCRCSYGGCWKAMRTCRALSATFEFCGLLSLVRAWRDEVSSSVSVGSLLNNKLISMITSWFLRS